MNRASSGSDNGLSPIRRQAIIWTNAGILLIGPLGQTSLRFWLKIQNFSFTKMHTKMSSAKWRPFCAGGDEINKQFSKQGWDSAAIMRRHCNIYNKRGQGILRLDRPKCLTENNQRKYVYYKHYPLRLFTLSSSMNFPLHTMPLLEKTMCWK